MNNKLVRILLLFFMLIFFSVPAFSQQSDEGQKFIEELIENISENSDSEIDFTSLYEDLNFYYRNPLNINTATREDLEKIQFLNENQIDAILEYIKKYGKMLSIYELQLVDGFEKDDIQRLIPFVNVVEENDLQPFLLKNALKYGKHELFLRNRFVVEPQKGFSPISDSALTASPNSRFLGNKYNYYVKYKYHYKNKLFFGFTAEKDAGEEFFKGTQKQGFDYYSSHIQINNLWKFKRIVLGDYELSFGQGLVMSSGFELGKSSMVLNINKKALGVRKYSSTDENNYFRGAATTIRLGKFDVSTFYSKKYIDANVTRFDSIDLEALEATAFEITGLHTTPNEVEDKHTVSQQVYGTNVTYKTEGLKTGITLVNYSFGANYNQTLQPYNQFNFRGKSNTVGGFDYQFYFHRINFFGEAAMSQNGGKAFVNGVIMPLAPQISLSVQHRHYERDYQSYYGSAFGVNSSVSNEDGWYIGAEIHPYKYWKISTYFDRFSFPWLRYRTDAPSQGVEYLVQVDYLAMRKVQMYLRFKRSIKSENTSDDLARIANLVDVDKYSFRYNISYNPTRNLSFDNRLELMFYNKADVHETGYLVYQDVAYKPDKLPITISLRYAVFDATYNARMYAYETDVLYAFSVPGYYYKGTRFYVTLRYSAFKNLDFYLRYGRFTYSDRNIISEGSLNEISGNTKSEVKIQARVRF